MFKVQCKNCNHENEISKENKKNYDISEISYISITKLFPKLLCSNCRQKKCIILKNNLTIIDRQTITCAVQNCNLKIVYPRLKALPDTKTCIVCASGEIPSKRYITNVNNENDFKDFYNDLKKLKKTCSEIDKILEINVCSNISLRKIALNAELNEQILKNILDKDNIFYQKYSKKIISLFKKYKDKKAIGLESEEIIKF